MFRSAGSVHLMKSPRLSSFSRPTTAATSRESDCLWMGASRKCRASSCGFEVVKNKALTAFTLLHSEKEEHGRESHNRFFGNSSSARQESARVEASYRGADWFRGRRDR